MYKIMIVDDEPAIILSTRTSISKITSGFEIIEEAYNGQEALEKIPLCHPDIILADIKMPVMDGIALVKKINELYPDIYTVIISGYDDFVYVKEALKSGAIEYLLKPIEPELLIKLTNDLSVRLTELYSSKSKMLLNCLLNSLTIDNEMMEKYLNYKYYSIAVFRKGLLPSRFGPLQNIQDNKFISELINLETLEREYTLEACWILNGRDEHENIMVIGSTCLSQAKNEKVLKQVYSNLSLLQKNITFVYNSDLNKINDLNDIAKNMQKKLSQYFVIGENQILNYNDLPQTNKFLSATLDINMENKLTSLILGRSMNLLKTEFSKLFQIWREQSYPQILLEKMLKQIFSIIEKQSPSVSANDYVELQLEEAFAVSNDFDSLLKNVWDLAEELLAYTPNHGSRKIDALEILDSIDKYLSLNLNKPISLQNICEINGVSQPYISGIYRKYKKLTFNEYLTDVRMNAAKRLIVECPDLLIKDISEMVGYQDSYYFSKVFKSLTGYNCIDFRKNAIEPHLTSNSQ